MVQLVIPNLLWLKKMFSLKLSDLFINNWYSTINMSSKCKNYRIYKTSFGFEEYLRNTPTTFLKYMIKFRTRNNRLPVEVGCWTNINYEDRKCKLCDSNCVGDEFHYILECSYFNCERNNIIKPCRSRIPNTLLFQEIMQIKPCTPPHKLTYLLKKIKRIITSADAIHWYVFCISPHTHCLWMSIITPLFSFFSFPHFSPLW